MAGAPKGNQNAAKGAMLSKRLQKRLEERKQIEALADALLDKAINGDIAAIKEVFDRIDGKSRQAMDIFADVIARNASELSDDELADIASRSGK